MKLNNSVSQLIQKKAIWKYDDSTYNVQTSESGLHSDLYLNTDYIISVISEEFGVIAIILILFLFLVLIYSIFKKVNLENDERTKLILVGCISLILMQAIIHIGVNIRLFPTTGMTLPYISYGGSSIISVSILSGIILNLTKRKIR